MSAMIILAAGEAKRAGGPKAVWPLHGVPSVRRVAEAALGAASVAEIVVVTGGLWAEDVRAALEKLPLKTVLNHDYALGQATSIQCGLAALKKNCRSAVFALADQPFLTSQIIDALLEFHNQKGEAITAPGLNGRRLNPVVFDLLRFREELMSLQGDTGGREIIAAHKRELTLWSAEGYDPICFSDFDTVDEYKNLGGR